MRLWVRGGGAVLFDKGIWVVILLWFWLGVREVLGYQWEHSLVLCLLVLLASSVGGAAIVVGFIVMGMGCCAGAVGGLGCGFYKKMPAGGRWSCHFVGF